MAAQEIPSQTDRTLDRDTLVLIAPIQALRALAAVGVCIAHAWPPARMGEAGVDIFFVISGFIIVYISEPLFGTARTGTFLWRRIVRIGPLYWFATSILMMWVPVRYGSFYALDWKPTELIGDYLFFPVARPAGGSGPYMGVGWTLFHEMQFYAIVSLFLFASRGVAVMATLGVLIALTLARFTADLKQPFLFWSDPIILEFGYGMLLALVFRKGRRLGRTAAFVLAGVGALGIIAAEFGLDSALPTRVFSLGLPSAALVAGAVLGPQPDARGLLWRVLLFWGNASYALYLVHPYGLSLPKYFLTATLVAEPAVYVPLRVLCALAVGAATHLLIERPILRFFRGRAVPAGRPIFRTPESQGPRDQA
jgi:peptidoglycan/LPS O-acetylase OafA/YrhL